MGLGQLFLNLAIIVDFSFLGVNQQNLSWLQTTFRHHVAGLKVHHTHLAGHYHHSLLGDGVATGAQTIAVEHTTCIAAIAEQQSSWSVPGLHQDRVIFVEGLQIFADRVFIVKALGHQDSHGLRQRESTHHQELEHVVETGRIAHAILNNRTQVLDIAQRLTAQHTLSCLHPAAVATNGVNLTVMGQQSERLCQLPFGERIG